MLAQRWKAIIQLGSPYYSIYVDFASIQSQFGKYYALNSELTCSEMKFKLLKKIARTSAGLSQVCAKLELK